MKRGWQMLFVSLSPVLLTVRLPADTPPAVPEPPAQNPSTITYRGREIPNTMNEILNARHTALIIHEMTNDLVSPGGSLDKQGRGYDPATMATLIPRIQSLLATARERNVRIIYVRYTKHADGSTFSDANRRNQFSTGELPPREQIEGEWGWEVIDAVKPQAQDLVLRKYRPDAFYGTILDPILRWNGIRTIVIVGVGAAVGVIPTVMTASNLGYFPVVITDGTLSADAKRTADAMTYIGDYALLNTHAEVIDIWNKSTPRANGVVVSNTVMPKTPGQPGELASVVFEGREIPIGVDEILNPRHTALVVNDMLKDFIAPGGGYDKAGRRYDPARMARIVPAIQKLLVTARAKNVRVVYVRSTRLPDGLSSSDPQVRDTWAANAADPPRAGPLEGTWGWEIIDEVKPTPGDLLLPKYRPDAFFGTVLDPILKWNGIKTIVLVGIDGEAGCLATLMRANYLGYFRVAVSDGILTTEAARMESAAAFISNHAIMRTHEEVARIWSQHAPRPKL
ncbi:MAG: isochorismatase family cysteine hydrolase [Gammaproteobacteria bacterium]